MYSDGTNAKLAFVNCEANPGTDPGANDLLAVDVCTLNANAVIAAGEYVAGDFAFI